MATNPSLSSFTNFYFIYGLMINKKSLKKILITSTITMTTITPRSGELESLLITIITMRMNTIRITLSGKQSPVGLSLSYIYQVMINIIYQETP